MKVKTILRIIGVSLLTLALSSLWFTACASRGGSQGERGLAVEEADIEVFPQMWHRAAVTSVAFNPDGRYVLSGSSDNTVKLLDTATGREIRTFAGHSEPINSVVFSPDGGQVLSGSRDDTAKLWDVATGREIRTFAGHTAWVNSVAFSPDGRYILSGSRDSTVRLWDVSTGNEIRTFAGHTDEINSVSFSPDGKRIVSGSDDKTIRLWDVETTRTIKTFSEHSRSLAFSPDGRYILSGSSDIKLLDVATGNEIRTFAGRKWVFVTSVAFSPDGRQVLSGFSNSIFCLWDATTGREIRTFSGHSCDDDWDLISIAFSPDGKYIASGGAGDKTVKLWDAVSGSEIRTFLRYAGDVHSVAFSPDGRQVLSGSEDGTIKLWDVAIGSVIRTFIGPDDWTNSLAFSPDGKYIAAGFVGGIIKLWDVATGNEIRTLSRPSLYVIDKYYKSIAFSPDGKYIAAGFVVGIVKLWDVATGNEIRTFAGHTAQVNSVSFSPDGSYVLSASHDKTVKLWDAATGHEIRTFDGVSSGVFSPDGRYILSDSHDNNAKLLDATTGREIRTFAGWHSKFWVLSTEDMSLVVFSPDGKQILSGSDDGIVRLWNVSTGKLFKTLDGHSADVKSVAFSPDGKKAISGSTDGTVRLWDVSTGKEIVTFISFSGSDTQLVAASRGLTVETQNATSSIEGEWLSITPDGYYQASPRGDRYLNVRVNNTISGVDAYRSIFYNPDVVQTRLQGKRDPKSKVNITIQHAASFIPPEVVIQTPANSTTINTTTTNLSVTITSQNRPIKNIKILVNGRLIGRDELTVVTGSSLQPERASLTVTGDQKTVNFTLPLELEPGNNRIEVVAFNGYSENRRYVDVTRNAPAGERPPLPNLWVVAVGVNGYDNAGSRLGGLTNLNFAVADAKGLVQSLKEQEGIRYTKVNSMLIADEEQLAPTAENIKQGFKFLEGADPRRDVVVLFLAGHGISAQESKFFFLPKDAAINGKNVDVGLAISGDEIMTVLDAPGNRLVFIDACQSGGVDNDRMVRSLMDTNAFVFAASRGNELSYESKELGHGFFTHSIMSALGGAPAALAEGRNVSVLSMSGFVKDDVPKKTGGRQNPSAYSLGFYDFPMAVINVPRSQPVVASTTAAPTTAQPPAQSSPIPQPASATPAAVPERLTPTEMVRINGGTFTMGSPANEPDRKDNEVQHQVTVNSFYMGKYEVTQNEYQEVMGTNPSWNKGRDNLPVEQVSWYDAIEYCNARSQKEGLTPAYTIDKNQKDPNNTNNRDNVKWTITWNRNANGYRLPTEAEWEYACRAGTTTTYNTGASISNNTGWYKANSVETKRPVGQKPANAYGLYDMHGNVGEWCWDWKGSYPSGAQTDLVGALSGSRRVVRGGSWAEPADRVRSAYRGDGDPSHRLWFVGFRLVRNAK
jgi:WD40 repeat protein/formylglycine-generating enzyme required for sulfatase activity